MESISQEVPEKPEEITAGNSKAPTRGAVLLFCGAIVVSVLLVVTGVTYAIWHGNHALSSNNQQWCTALVILTKTPVKYPADPEANPSRVFSYDLYESFRSIETKFGCQT